MNITENKKGFTLVELLAVIVILAIVMGIAAYSMQGVTENVRISSMKSSALSLVDGVRNELLSTMNLDAGEYLIGKNLLDKEAKTPWNTDYYFDDSATERVLEGSGLICAKDKGSFVRITGTADTKFDYEICLHDNDGHYIYAKETKLLESDPEKSDFYLHDTTITGVIIKNGKIDKITALEEN